MSRVRLASDVWARCILSKRTTVACLARGPIAHMSKKATSGARARVGSANANAPTIAATSASSAAPQTPPQNSGVKPTTAKSGKGDNSGDGWWRNIGVALLASGSTFLAALLTGVVGPEVTSRKDSAEKHLHAEVARSFQERRVKAVKERLQSTINRVAMPSEVVGDLFPRADAMAVVDVVAKNAGLYMICGTKGEGKSSLMRLLEASHPWVIRVDLQNDSMEDSVAKVAAATGYALGYTPEETAAKAAGFSVPDLPQGIAAYKKLLLVLEQACRELRDEGVLNGKVPVLVLDHANRPLPSPSGGASLVYTTVEIGHRFANEGIASLVLVTSDPQHEQEEWVKAGGRDSLKPIRAPPFTAEQADELLARRVHARLHPTGGPPSHAELAAVNSEYASTLRFARGAVGTRARWLTTLLQRTGSPPVPDRELHQRGVPVDPAYFPFLPEELRASGLRVDPTVWVEFVTLVTERKEFLKPLLEVPEHFWLPPHPQAKPEADGVAHSVLATDLALRDLLQAAAGGGATVETPSTAVPAQPGVAVGLTWEATRDKYFSGQEEALRRLCKKHVLFYNHGTRTVEFESELMRRVVADWLSEPRHLNRIELLHKVQEWQVASAAEAKAKEMLSLRKGVGTDQISKTALETASKELDQAAKVVRTLERDIAALREKLRLP